MSNYAHILTKFYNTPLLLDEGKLRIIEEAISRPLNLNTPEVLDRSQAAPNRGQVKVLRKVGIIEVMGTLTDRAMPFSSGCCSYAQIKADIAEAKKEGVNSLGFLIDSPGGSVGVFGLTPLIRGLKDEGIDTFCFCEGMATSAAYAIAASCERVYATELTMVASVAAVLIHQTLAGTKEAEGVTVFRSKRLKAQGDPFTELSDETASSIKLDLKVVDNTFNNDIITSRPTITLDLLQQLEGASVMAGKALELGLIDGIVPNWETLITKELYMSDSITTTASQVEVSTKEAEISALLQKNEELTASLKEANIQVGAETTRLLAIADSADKLGLGIKDFKKQSHRSADDALEILTAVAEASQVKIDAGIDNTVTRQSGVENRAKALSNSYRTVMGLPIKE